jgi:uncharacterized membrane protein
MYYFIIIIFDKIFSFYLHYIGLKIEHKFIIIYIEIISQFIINIKIKRFTAASYNKWEIFLVCLWTEIKNTCMHACVHHTKHIR